MRRRCDLSRPGKQELGTRRGQCTEGGAGWGDALDKQGAPSSGDALAGPASDIWGTPGSFLLPSLAAIAEMRPRSSRGLQGARTPGAGGGPLGSLPRVRIPDFC